MTLQQNQTWKKRDLFIRITRLERWEVAYKELTDLENKVGTHHVLPKKEFCRLIRGATLLEAESAAPPESETMA